MDAVEPERMQVRHRATGLLLGVGLVLTAERNRALVLDRAGAAHILATACDREFETVVADRSQAA